ncbi:alpha/beta hydrolase fold domain-containing protein [Mycobacterium sp. pV006]|uniref:alpha/beta hydrolase n=1 Tax=Mycobacterium sp. pV006 TaxID=3238983 RepID=UPI00351AD3BC
MADRKSLVTARVGGLAVAVGAGAVIACAAAAPAWADESDTGRGTQTSASTASQQRSVDAPSRRTDADSRARDNDAEDNRRNVVQTKNDDSVADADEIDLNDDLADPADEIDPSDDGAVSDVPTPADEETTPTSQPVGTTAVKRIDDTLADPAVVDTDPTTPPSAAPGVWTLLGSARRQSGDTVTTEVPSPTVATRDAVDLDAGADAAEPPQDVADLYTGKPSFIHNIVTAGLYVVQAILRPFGGLLAFTSLKVPFFTDGVPPFFLTPGLDVKRSEFEGMKVWTLTPRKNATDKAVVALHGGAYVATASIFHWWTYADMARDTGATVIVPLQTLVPAGGTAATEVPRTADFITTVIEARGAGNVSVFGDSAGGGLALAAMQELVRRNSRVPSRLVLLAPWLDVSMSDPRSDRIRDPLLDRRNLLRAGTRWGGSDGPADPLASPLFGSLAGLPPTYVYSSSLDLLTVDTLRLRDRVLAEQVPGVTFRLRKGLIHDWFTFPFLPDAHEDRIGVYRDLLGEPASAQRSAV